jgi:hypothetical protein
MGDSLLHTATLDAAELLDVVLVFRQVYFPKSKTGRSDGRSGSWLN